MEKEIEKLQAQLAELAVLEEGIADTRKTIEYLEEDIAELTAQNAFLEEQAGGYREELKKKAEETEWLVNGVSCKKVPKMQVKFHRGLAVHVTAVDEVNNVLRKDEYAEAGREYVSQFFGKSMRISRWYGTIEDIVPGEVVGLGVRAKCEGAVVTLNLTVPDEKSAAYRSLRKLHKGQLVEVSANLSGVVFGGGGASLTGECTNVRAVREEKKKKKPEGRPFGS